MRTRIARSRAGRCHRHLLRMAHALDEPLISVVIPCYNHAHFLAEAIESVRAQSYPRIEIVVVDDGSTDQTAEVARRYPGLRYLRQRNQGLAAARNAGLHASTGRYLVFLDADDRLLPGALHAGRECLQEHPSCAFAFGRYRWIAADGAVLPELPEDRPRPPDAYQAFLEGNYVAMHSTALFRREALFQVGGFDARLRECEDYDLYLRLTRTRPVAEHSALLAEYRQHGSNMSAHAPRMLGTVLRVLRAQRDHVVGNPAYAASYRKGVGAWRDYYGEQMLREVRRCVRERQWGDARRTLGALWRLCGARIPNVLLLYALPPKLRSALRRLRQRAARSADLAVEPR